MQSIIIDLPKPSDEDVSADANGLLRTLLIFANALIMTILSIAVGGFITVLGTIIVLETIHTKNLIVDLIVVLMTITIGAVTAIALRRAMLKTKNKGYQSNENPS